MQFRNRRRTAAVAVVCAFAFSTTAAPALAHFCFKTGWKNTSAAKSNAWMTAQDWIGFVQSAPPEEAPECAKAWLIDWLEAQPADTLFMGPGLLAGGTIKNGKGQPEQFGEVPFEQAFSEGCA